MAPNTHKCDACGGTGGGTYDARNPPCPVCLGSGTISDRMPVADAVADAETLRANNYLDGVSSDCLRAPMSTLWSYIDARGSARAAFRAVPGLREE